MRIFLPLTSWILMPFFVMKRAVKTKILISFTTTPQRIIGIEPMIASLLRQKTDDIRIVLWLSRYYWRSGISYGPEEVPEFIRNSPVEIVFDRDYGPCSKLWPALEAETDPDTLIINVDDDTVYPEGAIATLIEYSLNDPFASFGFRGKIFKRSRFRSSLRYATGETIFSTAPKEVDLLTGTHGVIYRRSFFTPEYFSEFPSCPGAQHADDIWTQGHIARNGIRRVCLPPPGKFRDIPLEQLGVRRLWDSVNRGKKHNDQVLRYYRKAF